MNLPRFLQPIAPYFEPGRLGRHASLQVAQILVNTGSRTAVLLVVTPVFGPVLLAVLGLFLNGLGFLQKITDGLGTSLVRSVAETRAQDEGAALRLALRASLVFGAMLGVLGFAIVVGVLIVDPEFVARHSVAVGITFLLGLFSFTRLLAEYAFRGLRLFSDSFRVTAVLAPLQAGLILWLVLKAGMRVEGYLGVLALESLLGAGWLLYVILRKARRNPAKLPVPSLRPVLTYSGSLILRGIIGFCFLRINVFLVEAVSSTEEVGYYYLADRFFLVPQLLLGAYSAAIAPRIAEGVARKDWKAVAGLAHRSNGVVLLLSLPFVVGFVASRPLFSLSILEEFQKTWPVLALFGLSLPPVAMAAVATGGLMVYSGRAHIALIAAVVVAVLNVGLCLLLSGPYGATGAGIAVLAASWIGGSVEIALAYRILRMPFRIRFFS